MIWENLREEEFKSAVKVSKGLCVIPIGCLEMHGQHLPLNTDNLIAEATARRAAEIEPVCVFPTFEFGDIQGLSNHHGSVIFSAELLQMMLTEICSEIARNGFKKIMLLNAHGGNTFLLGNFIRSTLRKEKDYVVMSRNAYDYDIHELVKELDAGMEFPHLNDEDKECLRDFVYNRKQIGHACLEETSLIMEIAPELVRLDRMHEVDGTSRHKSDYLAEYGLTQSTAFWGIDYPDSYAADHPEKASARIGRTLLDRYVKRQAEACRLLKSDDRVLEWNEERIAGRIR
nr:creatininase family protein [Clostridia bacterium]